MDSSDMRRICGARGWGLGERRLSLCCQPVLEIPTDAKSNGSHHERKAGLNPGAQRTGSLDWG